MSINFILTCFILIGVNSLFYLADASDTLLVTATIVGIIQTGVILLVSKKYHPLELFPLTMLLWTFQYSISGLSIFLFDLPLLYGVSYSYLASAAVLSNICQIIIAFVWKMPLWSKLADRIPRPVFPSAYESTRLIFFLWLSSLCIRIYLVFAGYQSGFEIEVGTLSVMTNILMVSVNFLSIFPIMYFCMLKKNDFTYSSLMSRIVLIIEIIMITIFAGTKAGPVILLINFAVAYHYIISPIKMSKTICIIIIGTVLVVPFYAIKLNARMIMLGSYSMTVERPKLTLNDYIWLYSKSISEVGSLNSKELVTETATALVGRLDVLSTLAATIRYYDQLGNYDLDLYLPLWVKAYVPRFLWQDKGWVGLGLFVSNEILGVSSYTHAAVTSPIEGYIAGGEIGSLLLAIINGALVSTAFCYLNNRRQNDNNELLQLYFVSIFLVFLYFTGAFVFIRAISTNLIILWLLFKFFKKFRLLKVRC